MNRVFPAGADLEYYTYKGHNQVPRHLPHGELTKGLWASLPNGEDHVISQHIKSLSSPLHAIVEASRAS